MRKTKYKTDEERKEAMRAARLKYYYKNKEKINNDHKKEYDYIYRKNLYAIKKAVERMIEDGIITEEHQKKYNFRTKV